MSWTSCFHSDGAAQRPACLSGLRCDRSAARDRWPGCAGQRIFSFRSVQQLCLCVLQQKERQAEMSVLGCQWILAHDQETGEGTIRLAGSTDRYNGDQLPAAAVAVGRVIDMAEWSLPGTDISHNHLANISLNLSIMSITFHDISDDISSVIW